MIDLNILQYNLFKMRKYLFLVMLVFVVATVSAQSCPSDGFMGFLAVNNNMVITQTCPTCTFITISAIKEPITSSIILSGQNMTLTNGTFVFQLNDSLITRTGTYFVEGFSNLDEPFIGCFIVNQSGVEFDNLWMNFIIIFLLSAGSFSMIYSFNESRQTIDTEGQNFIYYYLGAFMLFSLGVFTLIFGFGGYETLVTVALGYILWGSGLFFMTKPYFNNGRWSW